jgi:sulfite dehydrogenase
MKKVLATLLVLLASTTAADRGWKLPPETSKLERGPGVEIVTAQCLLCHSADYISIQPKMTRVTWTATVAKMKDKYGAPITPENVEPVVNYLTKTYGAEKPSIDKK